MLSTLHPRLLLDAACFVDYSALPAPTTHQGLLGNSSYKKRRTTTPKMSSFLTNYVLYAKSKPKLVLSLTSLAACYARSRVPHILCRTLYVADVQRRKINVQIPIGESHVTTSTNNNLQLTKPVIHIRVSTVSLSIPRPSSLPLALSTAYND